MRYTKYPYRRSRGFSLIELMVAMVIGLVITLAISRVMVGFEGSRRTSTGINDATQSGAFTSFALDRAIRNAGSGFAQRWDSAFGCTLNVSFNGTTLLPLASGFPAPFDTLTGSALSRRLIPVLIEQDQANAGTAVRGDILTVMSGTSGMGEWPQRVSATSVTASNFRLPNTWGWRGGDLVLLADANVPGGCIVEQVSNGFTASSSQTLNLATSGSVFYAAAGSTVNLTSFGTSSDTYAIQLGNPTLNNPPQFLMFAVGNNDTLNSYDLLQISTGVVPVADGIVEMRALYGLDTNGDRILDTWQDAGSGGFDAASLTNGSSAALAKLRQIVAVRVGLILRSPVQERDVVSTRNTITLFGDLDSSLQKTRTLSSAEQHFRYRTSEITIPLRNMLFLL